MIRSEPVVRCKQSFATNEGQEEMVDFAETILLACGDN